MIFKSTLLPRWLGGLMALAGFGWIIFLSPPLATPLYASIKVLGVSAEGSLMLWLLIAGVNVEKWDEKMPASTPTGPVSVRDRHRR